jgi:calcineurin-like phosphoesterase family protein
MSNIFVVSDTHFNHVNILGFGDTQGKKFRGDIFADVDHMNETMINNWNKLVSPQDKIYHLGDVYFGSQQGAENILSRLNGKKRLIVGNHDTIYGKGNPLQKHFQKIYMWRLFKEFNMVLTHVPIHESSFRKVDFNVHGHIHEKKSPTEQHINVSVEAVGYTPVHIEEVIKAYGSSFNR